MFISLPSVFKKYLEFFENNEINFCISGGYAAYRAGLCNCYTDVDIFIDNFNFNEKSFLELDNDIQVIPNENYVNVSQLLKMRFGATVRDSDGVSYKIDFVLMDSDEKIADSYSFSEYVTGGFDIDVCRVSIISVDEEYRLIFNSRFKVFIKNETQKYKNVYDEQKIPRSTFNRFLKYERRLKPCYRLFFSNCAPSFDFDRLIQHGLVNPAAKAYISGDEVLGV